METLIDGLQDNARRIAAEFDGPTVLRCRLVGNGPLHADLQREGMNEELQYQLQDLVDVESLRISTGSEIDRTGLKTEPIVSDFLSLVERAQKDPAFRDELAESVSPLFRKRELFTPGSARVVEWIEKAGALGVDLLLRK